ncbi:MAG: hypothetical protein HZB36_05210 [Candidatus Omnitrophica bacterium]|nr:hypothetical protein [Candidatus Omnitrophota bacterium]
MKKIIVCMFLLLSLAVSLFAEDFQEEKSTHFIIYHRDIPKEFVNTVIEYAERYYDELNEKLGFTRYDYWTWDKRAKIYLYPDQDSFTKATGQPAWAGGAAAYDQKTIWAFPREAGFFDSLLPHEIGHIVFREVIGGSRRVPLWLEEGVASYLEQAKRFGSEKLILNAMENNTFIPLKELSSIDSHSLRQNSDVTLFYAEAVNIMNFLIEKFGSRTFNEFCRKIKDGKSFDDALAYAYFDIRSTEGLSELWENHLRDKIKAKSKIIL